MDYSDATLTRIREKAREMYTLGRPLPGFDPNEWRDSRWNDPPIIGEPLTSNRENLEMMEAVVLKCVTESDIRAVIARVDVDFEEYASFLTDDLLIRLKAEVLGEHIRLPAIRYPANWKEAVKERFAPLWFLKRWPVQYAEKAFDVRVVYPMMALPHVVHSIAAVRVVE